MQDGNTAVSSIMRELSAYIAGALKKPLPKDVFSGERNFLFAFSRAPAPEKLTDGLHRDGVADRESRPHPRAEAVA
jgi:hypothetical protein